MPVPYVGGSEPVGKQKWVHNADGSLTNALFGGFATVYKCERQPPRVPPPGHGRPLYLSKDSDVSCGGLNQQIVAVFGQFGSLKLSLPPLWKVSWVLAQDLLADTAQDITTRVHLNASDLTLSGDLVMEVGTSARSAGDVSEPGLVLSLTLI